MPPRTITSNTLFYGDNLSILREYIASESVDLVYLDPPFNSNRNYNVLFKDERGQESEAQIAAFEDQLATVQSELAALRMAEGQRPAPRAGCPGTTG